MEKTTNTSEWKMETFTSNLLCLLCNAVLARVTFEKVNGNSYDIGIPIKSEQTDATSQACPKNRIRGEHLLG